VPEAELYAAAAANSVGRGVARGERIDDLVWMLVGSMTGVAWMRCSLGRRPTQWARRRRVGARGRNALRTSPTYVLIFAALVVPPWSMYKCWPMPSSGLPGTGIVARYS
jgi:hypothetical protein